MQVWKNMMIVKKSYKPDCYLGYINAKYRRRRKFNVKIKLLDSCGI